MVKKHCKYKWTERKEHFEFLECIQSMRRNYAPQLKLLTRRYKANAKFFSGPHWESEQISSMSHRDDVHGEGTRSEREDGTTSPSKINLIHKRIRDVHDQLLPKAMKSLKEDL